MENKDHQYLSGRREALRKLGAGSVALLSGGLGNLTLAFSRPNASQQLKAIQGPEDGPNQPMGTATGIFPGRVVWAWNPAATKAECTNDYKKKDFYFNSGMYDQEVIGSMFSNSLIMLTGKKNVTKAWDALFRFHNLKKLKQNRSYRKGEKIFIKINQTSARGTLSVNARREGRYVHPEYDPSITRNQTVCCETSPPLVLEILRHLVRKCDVAQADIAVGDNQNPIWDYNYDAWSKEFPDVVYTDCMFGTHGRTLVKPTESDLQFYSDKQQTDKLYDIIEKADYLINVPNLKPHRGAGITITAKNHFGSQARPRAEHLHYTLPTRTKGYRQYRAHVDIMGNRYLGQNTLLFVVEGLWGGGAGETGAPVKYFMAPFNGNWCNSILLSQDQVALDSVCYDILRTEWNGINKHDPINNNGETNPNTPAADDYLHQAADRANWPEDILYDPNNTGEPLSSLGVHEHWNNAEQRQYSRNLGKAGGIELLFI